MPDTKQNILVTGSLGYIGSRLVERLTAEGHSVTGVDIDYYHDATHGKLPETVSRVRHRRLDIRSMTQADFDGFDVVMHLAALSNDPLGNLDSGLTHEINHAASVSIARLAKQAGAGRFLFSSSCSSYGASGDAMLDESASLNPVTAYGVSKVAAERDILALASDKFSPTMLRNATAQGYSPRWRQDIVVNDFAAAAYLYNKIRILSDGTPWRPLVHVDDICSAFIAIANARRPAVHAECFNVGSPDGNYRVRQLADIVRAAVPECQIEYAAGGGPDKRCYRVDCSKLTRHIPSFKTYHTVETGVAEMLAAFGLYGLEQDKVDAGQYARLPAIKRRQSEGEIDSELRLRDDLCGESHAN